MVDTEKREPLELRHHADLTGEPGEELASASIGPTGEVIALWTDEAGLAILRSSTTGAGGAKFSHSETLRAVAARVTVHTPEASTLVRIPALPFAHPMVQPMPDGRVLLVTARCRVFEDGPDRNAIVYDADGHIEAHGTLGDGIKHVCTTTGGAIWVGYFDEGVYGTYAYGDHDGWGGPDGPAPIGASGLVRFSPDLRTDWKFPFRGDGWGPIGDCYALNIDGETAWTCYKSDFPLVRVLDGALTGWRNDAAMGVGALIVGGARAALVGGYGAEADFASPQQFARSFDKQRLVVGDLADEQFQVRHRSRFVLPDGKPVSKSSWAVGWGPDLHVLEGRSWYRRGLDDIA